LEKNSFCFHFVKFDFTLSERRRILYYFQVEVKSRFSTSLAFTCNEEGSSLLLGRRGFPDPQLVEDN
jgi:hypothetical protein